VGVITRDRPQLLRRLLQSFAALEIPPEIAVTFTVVENSATASLADVVDEFRQQVPAQAVVYDLQPIPGIPAARNQVLALAHQRKFDFVTFVDDDEAVAPDWLREIVAEQQRRDLDLVGGPVRLEACDSDASLIQRVVWQGLADGKAETEARCRQASARNADGDVTVVTNNWLVKREFLERSRLSFDERLAFTGGSDTAFYHAAKRAGAKTGWAPEAIVYEYIMPSRLTASYQLRRTIDQTMTSFHRKYAKRGLLLIVVSIALVLYKSLSAVLQLLASPLDRGRSFLKSVRNLGYALGRIGALLGWSSQHYRSTHGF
jgi:glycosyltransferase involved in cell wall biosynthesis